MMHAIAQTAPRLCKKDGKESLRARALAEIDTHLDSARRCIHWLIAQGIAIDSVDMRRGRHQPTITVVASPWLRELFADDCSSGQHWDRLLGRTVFDYHAARHGCAIHWHEVQA